MEPFSLSPSLVPYVYIYTYIYIFFHRESLFSSSSCSSSKEKKKRKKGKNRKTSDYETPLEGTEITIEFSREKSASWTIGNVQIPRRLRVKNISRGSTRLSLRGWRRTKRAGWSGGVSSGGGLSVSAGQRGRDLLEEIGRNPGRSEDGGGERRKKRRSGR